MSKEDKIGAVLVVGGGIGGMKASLDLAERGYRVYLLDKRPGIGGVVSQLDLQFPTNACGLCQILSPLTLRNKEIGFCMRSFFHHPNIEILSYTEVEEVGGTAGGFTLLVRRKATFVDRNKCIQCNECIAVCPLEVEDEFDEKRKVIYTRSMPPVYVIDMDHCSRCKECQRICPVEAIDFSQEDRTEELRVGAIILAPGFERFNPEGMPQYGYRRYPNVITSIEYERLFSRSGRWGEIVRPSDGKVPRRIGFIQCVGSRDRERGYCSVACCMYATKEAMMAKAYLADVTCQIFFMDMRTCGKGYNEYYEKAKNRVGVVYTRCRPSEISSVPESNNLKIKYETEEGQFEEAEFDLVVLSTGFQPPAEAAALGRKFGLEFNKYDFLKDQRSETNRQGIFGCGAFSEPKDIPDTVTQADEAVSNAAKLLYAVDKEIMQEKSFPEGKDINEQEPRIGIFVCDCGSNISAVIDFERVIACARTLTHVNWVQRDSFLCSAEAQLRLKEKIATLGLNRVVIAACTPRLYLLQFSATVQEAGLGGQFLEWVNIREQCAWVHYDNPVAATEKALDLIKIAVARSRGLKVLPHFSKKVEPHGLVIGGGLSGLTASLALAEQGFQTYLVEKRDVLGGHLRTIHYTLNGSDPQQLLRDLLEKVENNPLIHIYKNAQVKSVSGSVGDFKTVITFQDEETQYPATEALRPVPGPPGPTRGRMDGRSLRSTETIIKHGIVIVATGANPYQPKEYLYGKCSRVITQQELEERLLDPDFSFGAVVMIQCVGSRDELRPYCSRICCSQAIKNTLKLKQLHPKTDVFVLYRDIRTYGFKEEFYRQAREQGVIFIRYEETDKPKVEEAEGILKVEVRDPIINERLEIAVDLVVLSTAIVAKDNTALAEKLGVSLDANGFFQEANPKFRPLDALTDGIFFCGLAHSPRFIEESISQARGAAAKAAMILSMNNLKSRQTTSTINQRWCAGCGMCVTVCPFNVRKIDQDMDVAVMTEVSCQGCGACAAICPSGVSQLGNFEHKQVLAMVEELL